MAAAMPAASVAGGFLGAAGAKMKGAMTANSLNAQADVERGQADQAIQAGKYNSFRQELQATQVLSRATASYGASGVSSASGSVQDVLTSGAMNAELDRQNIIHEANIKAINYQNQASLNSFGANAALKGSYFEALGSLLGGAKMPLSNLVGIGGSDKTDMSGLTDGEMGNMKDSLDSLSPSGVGQQGGNINVP